MLCSGVIEMKGKFILIGIATMLVMVAGAGSVSAMVTVEKLTQLTTDSANEYNPSWSPDGNDIIFTRMSSPKEICKLTIDDLSEIRLTSFSCSLQWGLFSPDGTQIAYTKDNCNGWYDVHIVNSDGSSDRCLTCSYSGMNDRINWYSSSNKIIYENALDCCNRYPWDIISINPDGSDKTTLVSDVLTCGHYAMSPDDSKVLYSAETYRDSHIWMMKIKDLDDGTVTDLGRGLFPIPKQSWQSQIFSPDGSKIVYHSDEKGNWDIYTINVDATGKTQLTTDSLDDRSAYFSPDGSKILFESDRSGNSDIWVMDVDGSNKVQLTTNASVDTGPIWSPDGSKITFQSDRSGNYDIWVMDVSVNSSQEVQFKGTVTNILTFFSATVYTIQIDEIISDPTGSMYEGDTTKVSYPYDSPAQVDSVEIGDGVEVYGSYTRYECGGHHINLESSEHYLKKVEENKPDLIVSSINFNPNPADKYDNVIVSVTMKNQGNGDAGPHYEFLGYPDRFTILKEWYCSGLEAGASETFTHTLENVQHSDTYEACADWGQAVQESDDTNNCLTAYLEVKESEDKPDLTITDISWSPEFPTSLDVVTYTVEITNIGTATAEDFILTLDIDGVEVKEIDSLLPGKSCIQDFTIRQQCGYYHVMASVDPNHLIDERDDTNNDMVKHITIDCGGSVERALIIGIEDYKDGDDLNQRVVNSAQGMYDLLRWGYGYEQENVVLLLNEDATYNRIIFETKRLGSETDENDKFIFYYTGHGVKNETLETEGIVPYDAKVDDGIYASNFFYEVTGLFDLFFEDDFDGSLIAIFDTCYSGGFSKETDCDGDRNGIDGDRRVILMSVRADEDQISHTHHSQIFFTRYLLDAFASHSNDADRNDDQRVSVEEAFNYACTECESLPWPATQHPQIMDHYLDESNREAELYLSDEFLVDKIIEGEGGSSVHIHAYDSEGRHVGITDSDNIVSEIPGAWYSGPESHPEKIIIFGISEDITFTIEGQVDETFNFTIRQFTDVNEIIVNYDNVSIKETGIATVDVSQKKPYIRNGNR